MGDGYTQWPCGGGGGGMLQNDYMKKCYFIIVRTFCPLQKGGSAAILRRLLPLLRRRHFLLEELGNLQVDARRKRTLGAYARPVFVKKEWNRREEKRNAPEERRGPVDAQVDEHLRRKKWERCARRRADDRVACERRRRIHKVRVYQVAL